MKTEKEIIERLRGYKDISRLIDIKSRELARLCEEKYAESLPSASSLCEKVKKSGVSDPTFVKVWDIMERYDKEIERISNEIEELRRQRREIEEMVEKLPYLERTVVIMRYFQCKRWFIIENTLHYGQREPFYIHKRALKMLAQA